MIKVLDKSVSDKIAAGEVVERPISIVKELFENSIDSGADKITVEIADGGKSFIRVTDNGCGIRPADIERAFLRHATSKLNKIDDLDKLHTLGFRGEALASIAAVCRIEAISKTKDEGYGIKMLMEGGQVLEKSKYGAPDGTTIIARDLFFNTPAREKFLGSDRKEGSLIISFVSQMAIAYPKLKIKMVNNKSILFSTPGRGDRINAFATVGSNKTIENLIYLEEADDDIKLKGYISNPADSKANRRGQVIFVNGRVVETKVVTKGIDLAYADRLFEGRFPSAYLFLEVDPASIDVNIHPNKRSIRFYNPSEISDFVYRAIRKALKSREAIPDFTTSQSHKSFSKGSSYKSFAVDDKISYVNEKPVNFTKKTSRKTGNDPEDKASKYVGVNPDKEDIRGSNGGLTSEKTLNQPLNEGREAFSQALKREKIGPAIDGDNKQIGFNLPGGGIRAGTEVGISRLEILGQLFTTYILAKDSDAIYIIDQHAAQERIFFEEFKDLFKGETPDSQPLLLPFLIDIDISDMEDFRDKSQYLLSMGFEFEAFGPSSYRVVGLPHIFDEKQGKNFIEDFLASMDEYGDFESKEIIDKIATKACKASVKANDVLSKAEMEQLLKDLEGCENPFSCPHGRPTFLKMTKSQIESRFLRK